MADLDQLDQGDERGYRAFHFFVGVPTPIDIFGDVEVVVAEVQARSELQHIWSVKSHDLLYKPESDWVALDHHVEEDMRQLSNSIRSADQSLVSIRDRTKGHRK